MRSTRRGIVVAGLFMLGVGGSSASAQAPVYRAPRPVYTRPAPGRVDYGGYWGAPYTGRLFPTPNSEFFGRDYLNRPLKGADRGFVRDFSTARNLPFEKPWMRPARRRGW